ncbi:MAG TPA: hypothetical protein VGS03_16200, partial [Candidatus Polarisedimenticolia bacterium]|nr:hypothetical protein [Candidatus Polarisedimenticolia bacterium]
MRRRFGRPHRVRDPLIAGYYGSLGRMLRTPGKERRSPGQVSIHLDAVDWASVTTLRCPHQGDRTMARFLVEVPHDAGMVPCARVVDIFLKTGS